MTGPFFNRIVLYCLPYSLGVTKETVDLSVKMNRKGNENVCPVEMNKMSLLE